VKFMKDSELEGLDDKKGWSWFLAGADIRLSSPASWPA